MAQTPGEVLQVGEWPGGTIIAMECAYPESVDGGVDLSMRVMCEEHHRTVWWCLNTSDFWCDGGPPNYEYHTLSLCADLPF